MRDSALERAFAERQSWAYEAAYRRFGARMYTAALRVLADRGAAQDCVHEVMLHLWKRGDAYRSERGSLEAFLVTCSRNRGLERLRSAGRQFDAMRRAASPDESEALMPDPIERDRIARAIESLPPAQAQTIQCAYFKGMTLTEIASALGEPVGTIKSRLSAALRALRSSLVTADV
ncbi:MAG: sigma-70 family RNA polymerase sigma factor [Candidatus Aquilonibacter sp.]|jgi:RNA polymerase sigma-70 factor (ECF subfamily)